MITAIFSIPLFSTREEPSRNFLMDYCYSIGGMACSVLISGNDLSLELKMEKYKLQEIDIADCKGNATTYGNNVTASGCSFNRFYNDITFSVYYQDPESGLVHGDKFRLIEGYELSGAKDIFNATITGFFGVMFGEK